MWNIWNICKFAIEIFKIFVNFCINLIWIAIAEQQSFAWFTIFEIFELQRFALFYNIQNLETQKILKPHMLIITGPLKTYFILINVFIFADSKFPVITWRNLEEEEKS